MDNIFHKSFDNITGKDIQNLIDIQYKERQTMEFKKEMYGRSDGERREMLRDISSIANAYGGYLIIGIEEDDDGFPTRFHNINDAEIGRNRIEQSSLSSIEPRISGLKSKTIKIDTGEDVIIVFIPRSLKKPHMVTLSGLNQFWIRHNDKKFPMSVEEIRDACLSVSNIWKEMKQFLYDRDIEIIEEISNNAFLVIGSSPILTNEDIIDISNHEINDFLIEPKDQIEGPSNLSFKNWGTADAYPIPTLYGLKISYHSWISVELFRNGYYELKIPLDLFTYQNGDKTYIHYRKIIEFTVNYFRALASLMELLGIEQTIVTFMSLFNVKELTLKFGRKSPRLASAILEDSQWPDENLKIPPKQIFNLSNPDKEAKYFLDRLWNAFGFTEVPHFKEDKYTS